MNSERDLCDLDASFADEEVVCGLTAALPEAHAAAGLFWRAGVAGKALSARMRELVLLSMHGSTAALNEQALARHARRAIAAGASEQDVLDALLTIVGLANHGVYDSLPVLEQELASRNLSLPVLAPHPDYAEAKRQFIARRGFWSTQRDRVAQILPDYVHYLTNLSTVTCNTGSLTDKERELLCVAIDCTVNHVYEYGLRTHIRNALDFGASPEELLEVLQLAGVLGLEGYILGAEAIYGGSSAVQD